MTLNEIIKIQSVIDNRAIAKDTLKTLKNKFYYSKSKGVNIAIGDMHIDHFLRAFKIDDHQKKDREDFLIKESMRIKNKYNALKQYIFEIEKGE
tara:strand:+ start:288 stop:569 length:282 start_codon:yes stop_codon:yes gene_type:complete